MKEFFTNNNGIFKKLKGWLHFRIYRLGFHFDLTLCKRWKWRKYLFKDSKVLEVGSGGGPWTIELLIKNNKVTVVDISKSCFERLRKKVDTFPLRNKNVRFTQCHVKDFTSQEKYDQIILFEVLEHIKDDELVVKNLSAMLKPSGQMLISTPSKDHQPIFGEATSVEEKGGHIRKGYTFSDYDKMLSKNGLEIAKQDSCSGFFTRKSTALIRLVHRKFKLMGLVYLLRLLLRPVTCLDILYPGYAPYVNFVIAKKIKAGSYRSKNRNGS